MDDRNSVPGSVCAGIQPVAHRISMGKHSFASLTSCSFDDCTCERQTRLAGGNSSGTGVLPETSNWDLAWHLLSCARPIQNCVFIARRCRCCRGIVFPTSNSISRSDRIVSREPAALVCSRRTLRLHRRIRVFRSAPQPEPFLWYNPQHLSLELDGLHAVFVRRGTVGNFYVALGKTGIVVNGHYDADGLELSPLLPQHSRRGCVDRRLGGCIPFSVAALDGSSAMDLLLALRADAAAAFHLCVFDPPPQRIHHPILVVGSVFHALHGLDCSGSESRLDSAHARGWTGESGIIECLMSYVHESDQLLTV